MAITKGGLLQPHPSVWLAFSVAPSALTGSRRPERHFNSRSRTVLFLHRTNPPSSAAQRANSTMPKVIGSEENEIEINVVRFPAREPAAIAAAGGDPNNVGQDLSGPTRAARKAPR